MQKRGKDINKLIEIMNMIINEEPSASRKLGRSI